MSRPLTPTHGQVQDAEGHQHVEIFPTLKQSLAASVANGSAQDDPKDPGQENDVQPAKPRRASPPISLTIPKLASPPETALAALRYLPIPVLVLSSLKTVILANEAMGRFLRIGEHQGENQEIYDEEEEAPNVEEALYGQTLSQIGVEMLQNGQPLWVNWDVRRCYFGAELLSVLSTNALIEVPRWPGRRAVFRRIVHGEFGCTPSSNKRTAKWCETK